MIAADRRAGCYRCQPGNYPQQASLSDAARAQKAGPDALFQHQIQAVEQHRTTVAQSRATERYLFTLLRRSGAVLKMFGSCAGHTLVSYAGMIRFRFEGSSATLTSQPYRLPQRFGHYE